MDPITLATAVIAFFTVALFLLQYFQHRYTKKLTRANYNLALFDKRMETYFEIERFLKEFSAAGRPTLEAAVRLRYNVRTAHFLFPEPSLAFVDEFIKKSFEYHRAYLIWEPLRKRAWEGEELSEEEDARKTEALDQMHTLEHWYLNQIEENRLEKELGPFLKLPESV